MSPTEKSTLLRIVDTTCDRFEEAWLAGSHPSIAKSVAEAPAKARERLFEELLRVELELRATRGDSPDQDEYLARFTDQREKVDSVFADWQQSSADTDDSLPVSIHRNLPHDTARHADETVRVAQSIQDKTHTDSLEDDVEILPRKFGRYKLMKLLGSGGMGRVYLARDKRLDRLVALKLPNLNTQDSHEATLRFYREARAMATVQHPNLCPIFDVGEEADQPYLTMAYFDGGSLKQRIEQGAVAPAEAAKLIEQLALAMQVAHESGVVHRDLKPSNVMLNASGEPSITDFGLAARDRQIEADLTHSGHVLPVPPICPQNKSKAVTEISERNQTSTP